MEFPITPPQAPEPTFTTTASNLPVFPTRAHEIAARAGLRIWRHVGSDGVNVRDEALMHELHEAGCVIRPYQPDPQQNPDLTYWEAILPQPEEPDDEEAGTE